MRISVLTATYNREKLLQNVYESLLRNHKTFQDFEWLIMDDGSTDKTEQEVKKWIKEKKMIIHYFKQENRGKMAAINELMKKVQGEITIELDSDDSLVDNALKRISDDYEALKQDQTICGIIYPRDLGNVTRQTISSFLEGQVVSLWDLHNRYGFDFDMTVTFFAKYRKKYDYELEHHEKFVTEARTYYKLEKETAGFLIHTREPIIIGSYLEDGYTKNIKEIFQKYPYGYYEYFKECLNHSMKKISLKRRLYFIKHYILFSYLTKKTLKQMIKEIRGSNCFLTIILYLPGRVVSKKRFPIT